MGRVYECVEWNDSTQSCDAAAWVEQSSIPDWLPTVDQAQAVGFAMFASLAIIASMGLLLPRRSSNEE